MYKEIEPPSGSLGIQNFLDNKLLVALNHDRGWPLSFFPSKVLRKNEGLKQRTMKGIRDHQRSGQLQAESHRIDLIDNRKRSNKFRTQSLRRLMNTDVTAGQPNSVLYLKGARTMMSVEIAFLQKIRSFKATCTFFQTNLRRDTKCKEEERSPGKKELVLG